MAPSQKWERRWHPLREEWVVYAAHRNSRPWSGASSPVNTPAPEFDPQCYLCPGNKRVSEVHNPAYKSIYVFNNDHPVVGESAPTPEPYTFPNEVYQSGHAQGISRVICFSPNHSLSLGDLEVDQVFDVFRTFREQTLEMLKNPSIHSLLIFENRGQEVGVSNPHPHGQLYATTFPLRNIEQQCQLSRKHLKEKGKSIFDAIVENELADHRRLIIEDDLTVSFIPYFARYAYETMIFPKSNYQHLGQMDDESLRSLARNFRTVVRKMDRLYEVQFPYVLTVMQAPVDQNDHPEFRLHLWLQPPLRRPGLLKYLAGPELGAGNFMADTMPEEKAEELRNSRDRA
ncbi:MAG: galactose-1-phosphate uridylyltransferase [Bacteroidetes bacterium]|nr:galactose-1-phosphate uridylyltransferase [Bacteroidota bacterium]